MKRSQINRYIYEAMEFWNGLGFKLPPYASYDLDDWIRQSPDSREIFEVQIGWDITSFGTPDFLKCGLTLYTLRNGKTDSSQYPKTYAEKIMMVRENQITPLHFHWKKREDIINRGGGNLIIELYRANTVSNTLCEGTFLVSVNGMHRLLNNGDKVVLTPGESITMEHFHAHRFYGEPGSGASMIGEVSTVNDDQTDNCFLEGNPRFMDIEEDEKAKYLLAREYADYFPLHRIS